MIHFTASMGLTCGGGGGQVGRMSKVLRAFFWGLGVMAVVACVEAVLLFWAQPRLASWLAEPPGLEAGDPDWIVVLGGGGIPSESGLIRCWYGAERALEFPEAGCIVSLPADEDPEEASVGRMKQELMMRGVAEDRIRMESEAVNTRAQADAVMAMLGASAPTSLVCIVTSPYHLRRAVDCFRAAGFRRIQGAEAESVGAEADMGGWTFLRYGLWAAWSHRPVLIRECMALAAYGWTGKLKRPQDLPKATGEDSR